MQERRELPRWQIGKQVKVRMSVEECLRDCTIEDMNLKGMCVSLSQPLPQDHPVRMTVLLAEKFDLNVEVRVPWVREKAGQFVHGVSFSAIMDADKDKIYQYVSRHCFKQFQDNWWSK